MLRHNNNTFYLGRTVPSYLYAFFLKIQWTNQELCQWLWNCAHSTRLRRLHLDILVLKPLFPDTKWLTQPVHFHSSSLGSGSVHSLQSIKYDGLKNKTTSTICCQKEGFTIFSAECTIGMVMGVACR